MSIEVGQNYEKIALDFLTKRDLKLIEKNFSCKVGEIDLIMQDDEFLIFTEVRFRKPNDYATGLESITYSKQRKIIKTAQYFLLRNRKYQNHPCRFDVVSISRYDNKVKGQWVKNAFQT